VSSLPPDIAELGARVRNWGRWGDDDQIGTLNLIDDAAVRRALGSATSGRRFSLALPLSVDGPQMGFIPGRENPSHDMIALHQRAQRGEAGRAPGAPEWNDDSFTMGTQASTHWDGLAHAAYDGHIYNGFPAASVTDAGASRCGIERVGPLVTRGVLLDVARARGVDRLDPGHALTPDDLDAAVELARTEIEPGDVVLIRTGHIQLFFAGDRVTYGASAPGPSLDTVEWFHTHDVAAVVTDNLIFEVFPGTRDDEILLPVHFVHLVDMGLTQGQNWNLEELAADCAEDGRSTFLLSAPPEPLVGGVGSPVHPVAVK
jgi:kynurenine formamidase